MSVSGDPDEYMGDDGDDLPLEGSSQFAMDLDKGAEWLRNLTNAEITDLHAYDKADIAQSLARLEQPRKNREKAKVTPQQNNSEI